MKNLKREWIGIMILVLALLFGTTVLRANKMFLVEDYIEGDVELLSWPMAEELKNQLVASISFTLDRQAFVTIATGGIFRYYYVDQFFSSNQHVKIPAKYGCSWITMNGEKLAISVGSPEIYGNYVFALDPGNYEFELRVNTINLGWRWDPTSEKGYALLYHPRIQALVILSDTVEDHVAEKPPERGDPIQTSLVTSGPSVTVPGCVEVRDITGRTVKNCIISKDRVMLSTLSRGTYFLERENGRSVKLVKM